jgi:hypothetical protein
MRRRDKYIFKGILIGGGILLAADIFLQWIEKKEKVKN